MGSEDNSLIDDHDHALGAVVDGGLLAAEQPDGLGVVDSNGEDGSLGVGLGGGHEAGFDHGRGGGGVGLAERDAGGVEGGLGDGVILLVNESVKGMEIGVAICEVNVPSA